MITMRLIKKPDAGTLELLLRRTYPEAREAIAKQRPGAVGLFQAKLPDLYYLADQAVKAGNVYAAEITGTCPQHLSTIALFGDLEAVRQSLRRIAQIDRGSEGNEI